MLHNFFIVSQDISGTEYDCNDQNAPLYATVDYIVNSAFLVQFAIFFSKV